MGNILKPFVFSLLAWSVPSASLAEKIFGSDVSFQNWTGAAYTDDSTGIFSHCAISANYLSGDTLYFSVTRDGSMGVGVISPNLNLEQGAEFPVMLSVDRMNPFYGIATALEKNFATLFITDLDGALGAFKRGCRLVIEGQGLRGTYDLTGTFRALDQVTGCAINYFSFAQAPTVSQAPSVSVDTGVLYQIAARTITSFGITDFKFDSAETIAALGLGDATVRWTAPQHGVSGTVLAVNYQAGDDIRSSDAADIQFVASFCEDEFASTTQNLSEGGQQIREIRVLCVSQDQQTEHYISKFVANDLVYYTWFQFDGDVKMPSGESSQSEASNAAISAASFVIQ